MLIPCSVRAAEEGCDEEVTFTYVSANPVGYYQDIYYEDGYSEVLTDERAQNLFDGNTNTKWCFDFSNRAYVIFKASKPGFVSGYTITTGSDSGYETGRNPKGWTLYGSNDQENWAVIDQVSDDTRLQDVDATAYDYLCLSSEKYEYFKWEITKGGSVLQVSELKLELLDNVCTEHQIEKIPAVEPTCTKEGHKEYYQCKDCGLLFKNASGTDRFTDKSYVLPAKGHQWSGVYCEVCNALALQYTISDEKVTINGFIDGVSLPDLSIPAEIEGKPVVSINERAFYKKTSIERLEIPGSVENIGNEAFYGCNSLTTVAFAETGNLDEIGKYAFEATSLQSVHIPSSVTKIGHSAFKNIDQLSSLTFAEDSKLNLIDMFAFASSFLSEVKIPASVKR